MTTVGTVLGTLLTAFLFGGFLYLLHERRLPVIVMRLWFAFCLVVIVIVLSVLSFPIRVARDVGWVSRRHCETLTCWICCFFMGKGLWFLSPHIHIHVMEGSLDPHSLQQNGVLCACHTSFFDTILFMELVPLRYVRQVKAFAKKALWNLPLMGKVIDTCGHFPVHFTVGGAKFAVDKEKQAAVTREADEFVKTGGSLCVFPEGTLNRTPETLKDFRLGTFSMITKHHARLYYFVHNGCHEVWPPALDQIPGFPADIYVYFGEYKYSEESTAEEVSKGLREVMQRHVDDIMMLRRQANGVTTEKKAI